MSNRPYLHLLLTLLVGIVGFSAAPATAAEKVSYIVVLEDSVQAPGEVARGQAAQRGGDLGFVYRHAIKGYSVELPEQAVEGLRRDPRVRYVIEDGWVEAAEEIELETEENEWVEAAEATIPTGISRTFAATNKALDIDGQDDTRADVDVAVLDSGIDATQPDLRVAGLLDCTQGGETCTSNSGSAGHHGTHVAGTIGALDNGFGVVGMAPGARLWSVKVLTSEGKGKWSWVIAGVDWVAANSGAIEVANLSFGGIGFFPALTEGLEQGTEEGVVYTVAAGNNNAEAGSFIPGNITPLLTVSAIADYDGKPGGKSAPTCVNRGPDDHRAEFSNYGAVDIAAPGVCILSTTPLNSYGMNTGTSMAAPHVAGAAAILAAKDNPDTEAEVEAIQSTLISTGNYGWTDTSGDGTKEPLLDVHDETIYSLVAAPTVATGPVSFAGMGAETETLLTGSVNPNGLSTTYQFEYVSAAKYKPEAANPYAEGAKAPLSPSAMGSGSKGTAIEVKQALTGLEPNTTYHYRLVAENAKGISRGSDQAFVSLPSCKGSGGKCEWSLQSPANPQPWDDSDLEDVSCAGSSMCMGVGNDHYREDGFAQLWNGSEWKIVHTFSGEAKAVSCPTSTWCMAVASNKAWQLKWTEVSGPWKAEEKAPPTPEGGTQLLLNDVSCTSESACTLVGRYFVSGAFKPYVARWNGSSWSLQSAPAPSSGNAEKAMLAVSCGSTTSCVAVGTAAGKPFVEGWNGSEWTIHSVPSPEGGTEAVLEDVSCSSSNACMAVGNYKGSSGGYKALSERWNGSSWSLLSNPAPSKEGHLWLRGVSCQSASSCVAVGSNASPLLWTAGVTWAQYWNGTSWTLQSSPNPAGKTFSSFAAVSCTSALACTAVGQAGPQLEGAAGTVTLAERWNGEAWSLQSPANPQSWSDNDLEDVSCAGPSMCLAVGNDHNRGVGFAQFWNGSTWKISNSFSGEMKAISCPTTTWCMTVAKSEAKGWQLQWIELVPWLAQAKAPPTPEGATQLKLNDVSCTSESACTVVGRYFVSGAYKPYVARWNGSNWSLQSAPGPGSGTAEKAMLSVSCASATYCVAVGTAAKKPFVERWNGSSWSIQSPPNPEGATEAALEGVSCTSSGACMAVGYSKGSSGANKTLTMRWNGSNWSLLTNPAPSKEGHAWLRSVSCVSASSCVAVGSNAYPLFSEGEDTLAQSWNGTSWTLQPSPNPAEKAYSSFAAISCTSPVACTAVGQAGPQWEGGANTVTLAERFN